MSDTCGRCGRRLKDPFFREVGYGRTCAAKLGITLPQKKEKGQAYRRAGRKGGGRMKEIVSQQTNGVICEDGKIAKNGLRVICPFCGEIGLSQGRGGSVNVWTVGAIERRECTKCRKQFHTIALTVPPDMTPEDFYSAVRARMEGR